MPIEIRPPRSDQIHAFVHVSQHHTGRRISDDEIEAAAEDFGFDRALAAWDDAEMVATALASPVELTVAGPAVGRAALVTACATLPTHRRRGLLRELLVRLLDEARSRGEPFAVLGATDSGVYGRFGFGVAAMAAGYSIETAGATLRDSPAYARYRVRLIGADEATTVLPAVFELWRRETVGAIGRRTSWWSRHAQQIAGPAQPARRASCALAEDPDGAPVGYAIYQVDQHDPTAGSEPATALEIMELVATAPHARLALWRHCIARDLVTRVTVPAGPTDEPLRWALVAPRRLATTQVTDALWLRLLDIEHALTLRGYERDGSIRLGIRDTTMPALAGTYELTVEGGAARCARTDSRPDLALDVSDLACAYLGAVTLEQLADAGQVRELTRGAVTRAGGMFATRVAPYCNADL